MAPESFYVWGSDDRVYLVQAESAEQAAEKFALKREYPWFERGIDRPAQLGEGIAVVPKRAVTGYGVQLSPPFQHGVG